MVIGAFGLQGLRGIVGSLCVLLGLAGCTSIRYQQQLAVATATPVSTSVMGSRQPDPKTIAIFFDGTHNDFGSDTNVKRLHALMTLQDRRDLATLYMEGVGTDSDVICSATGCGVAARVRLAYGFLLDHYRAGDRILLFGFSRGAYQARMLASLLNQAGLPDSPPDVSVLRALLRRPPDAQPTVDELATVLFEELKAGFHRHEPARTIARARQAGAVAFQPREVEFLGLWDTVEALGKPDWMLRLAHKMHLGTFGGDIDEPNDRYGDQLLNVRHAVQALSLDDDREWIFTPLPIQRCHLFSPKPLAGLEELPPQEGFAAVAAAPAPGAGPQVCAWQPAAGHTVEEVWFPGAHSDVGGGYPDTELPGLSLNWMIGRLRAYRPDLWPTLAGPRVVREDAYGNSHDPEAGWARPLYHAINRNVAAYVLDVEPQRSEQAAGAAAAVSSDHAPLGAAQGRLCLHPSVWDRRELMPARAHENRYLDFARLRRQPTVKVVACEGERARPPILREQGLQGNCTISKDPWTIELQTWDEAQGRCGAHVAATGTLTGALR